MTKLWKIAKKVDFLKLVKPFSALLEKCNVDLLSYILFNESY